MAADKGCSGQEGQETSPKGRRMQTYLSVPEDETVHPYLPPSSHILVPQIWVKTSRQVRSMRVQCDKPQVTNGEKATGQIVPQVTLQTTPTFYSEGVHFYANTRKSGKVK